MHRLSDRHRQAAKQDQAAPSWASALATWAMPIGAGNVLRARPGRSPGRPMKPSGSRACLPRLAERRAASRRSGRSAARVDRLAPAAAMPSRQHLAGRRVAPCRAASARRMRWPLAARARTRSAAVPAARGLASDAAANVGRSARPAAPSIASDAVAFGCSTPSAGDRSGTTRRRPAVPAVARGQADRAERRRPRRNRRAARPARSSARGVRRRRVLRTATVTRLAVDRRQRQRDDAHASRSALRSPRRATMRSPSRSPASAAMPVGAGRRTGA